MNRFGFFGNKQIYLFLVATLVVIGFFVVQIFAPASGAKIERQALQVGAGSPSQSTTYNISFDTTTLGVIGSIKVEFCSNSPLVNRPCTPPVGFSLASATLASQTGITGLTKDPLSTNNVLILSRTPGSVPVGTVEVHLNNVINPSSVGPYYARIYTYPSVDASGPENDAGGLAFVMTNEITLNAEVPPFLTFCTGLKITGLNCDTATGDYIDFGELSSKKSSSGTSQMLVATNAANGYSITGSGTTLTSGNNVINQLSSNDISRPGVGQFGYNLRANSSPPVGNNPFGPGIGVANTGYNQPNMYRFVNGESVASSPGPDDKRQYTVSYLVNIPAVQSAGIYVTTITYVCLANF